MNELPRILVCAPVSDRHAYVIKKWMKAVDNIDYPKDKYAVCLVDNSLKKGKFGQMLRKWASKGKKVPDAVIDLDWNPENEHPIQMIARAREAYRQVAWKHKYDYILHLDTDVMFPRNGLRKLLSYDKDQVGFVVHAFYTKQGYQRVLKHLRSKNKEKYVESVKSKPLIFKSGNINFLEGGGAKLDYMSWKELRALQKLKQPVRVYASTLSCLLVKKKVFSTIPFRTHPSFIFEDALWYYAEADEKGFESWCDTRVRCRHLNTHWQIAINSKHQTQFQIGIGNAASPDWKEFGGQMKGKNVEVAVAEVAQVARR